MSVVLFLSLCLCAVGWLALRRDQIPLADRRQVEQNGLEIARKLGMVGEPAMVASRAMTRGALGLPNRCNDLALRVRHLLSPNWNHRNECNPNAVLWMVRVKGRFARENGTDKVSVLMGGDGSLIEAGSYEFPAWRGLLPE